MPPRGQKTLMHATMRWAFNNVGGGDPIPCDDIKPAAGIASSAFSASEHERLRSTMGNLSFGPVKSGNVGPSS